MPPKNKKDTDAEAGSKWPFGTKNYILLAVAVVVIAVGYIMLGQGSETLSPILLVIGYVVLIPAAIIVRDKKNDVGPEDLPEEQA